MCFVTLLFHFAAFLLFILVMFVDSFITLLAIHVRSLCCLFHWHLYYRVYFVWETLFFLTSESGLEIDFVIVDCLRLSSYESTFYQTYFILCILFCKVLLL